MKPLSPEERQKIFNEKLIQLGSHIRDPFGKLIPNPKCGYDEALRSILVATNYIKEIMNPKIKKRK